jgi:hypothetical protein
MTIIEVDKEAKTRTVLRYWVSAVSAYDHQFMTQVQHELTAWHSDSLWVLG